MKNTFLTSKKIAIFLYIVIAVSLLTFGTMFIYFISENQLFESFLLLIFIILGIVLYISARKKGFFDRVKMDIQGITILRGLTREVIFIPWDNVVAIKKLKFEYTEILEIESNVIYKGKPYFAAIQQRDEIDELLAEFYTSVIGDKIE